MSEPWILDDFEAGLKQLEVALSGPIRSDLERAGCIQYFESLRDFLPELNRLLAALRQSGK